MRKPTDINNPMIRYNRQKGITSPRIARMLGIAIVTAIEYMEKGWIEFDQPVRTRYARPESVKEFLVSRNITRDDVFDKEMYDSIVGIPEELDVQTIQSSAEIRLDLLRKAKKGQLLNLTNAFAILGYDLDISEDLGDFTLTQLPKKRKTNKTALKSELRKAFKTKAKRK